MCMQVSQGIIRFATEIAARQGTLFHGTGSGVKILSELQIDLAFETGSVGVEINDRDCDNDNRDQDIRSSGEFFRKVMQHPGSCQDQ